MFRTLSQGDSISVAQRKLLQRGRRECQAIYKFATRKQIVWTSKFRYQVKVFSILCTGRCKSLASLNLFFSPQLSGPILFACSPCFLHSPSSSAVTMGWQHPLDHSFGRPEITDGCDISCLLTWQEIFSFHSMLMTSILEIQMERSRGQVDLKVNYR